MQITGQAGGLFFGYQAAAEFASWEVQCEPRSEQASVDARVKACSTYWLQKAPLTLKLEAKHSTMIWSDVTPYGVANGSQYHVKVIWPPHEVKEK